METSEPRLRLPPPRLRGQEQLRGRKGQAPSWMWPPREQSDGEQGAEGAQEAWHKLYPRVPRSPAWQSGLWVEFNQKEHWAGIRK